MAYSVKVANEICELVANGSNLHVIGKKKKFPTRKTIYEWLGKEKSFCANYARAREGRADWRANDMDKTIQDLKDGKLDYQTARLAIDNHKWQAGKENPPVYGDKVDLNHGAQPTFSTMMAEIFTDKDK